MFYSWSTSIYTHTAQRVWGLNSCTALRTHLSVRLINEKKATIYQMELSNGGARIPTKLGRGQDVSYISLSLFDVQNQKKDNFLLAKRGFRPCLFNMLLMVLTKTALEYELINFFFLPYISEESCLVQIRLWRTHNNFIIWIFLKRRAGLTWLQMTFLHE